MKPLQISEIFYSLQGEGERAGTSNVFIRLRGCKTASACYASGIRCDTEFASGRPYYIFQLEDLIDKYPCKSIIWTGGEPADQLDEEIVSHFKALGYYQCIETSGLQKVPAGIDYIVVSPKVAEHVVAKNFTHVQELRYVRHSGQGIPVPSITADHYCISPHSDGFEINGQNLKHCIELVKNNPGWRLSVQQHKLWMVL
jgi:7-carboxy-7-deazaguanine synthase